MTPQRLFQHLEQGVTLVTATQRLAREITRRYDAHQAARGRAAWPGADVLPLTAWVRRCWEEALDAAALSLAGGAAAREEAMCLLSEPQARVVWEDIVAGASAPRELLRPAGAARLAREAWRTLQAWQVPVPAPGAAGPPEVERFAAWAQAYAQRCRERGWLDAAALPDRVAACFRDGVLAPPARLLVGEFDDVVPQQAALLRTLEALGTQVAPLPWPRLGERRVRVALPDAGQELWAAARWARHHVEHAPGCRVGVVVPALTALRPAVQRIFADVLAPGHVLPGCGEPPTPCNISRGRPLADYPLVRTALELLALSPAAQPLAAVGALLRSPFVGGAEREQVGRGLLEHRLRDFGAATLSPARLQTLASGDAERPGEAPALGEALGRWRRTFEALPARQAPSGWAASCSALLDALGWPGERPRNSAEHQTLEKWRETVETFARLDLVAPALTLGQALAALRTLAAETEFQPEGSDAPVQVLGVLESGGLAFDHLWVAGLHDEAWPAPPRPNPFLPVALQRRHDMPHASMARELAIARRETERLLDAAPDVVVSHPEREGDRALRPSPLVRALPLRAPAELPATGALTLHDALAPERAALESLPDFRAPPVAPEEVVQGGTGLFADQAACPFRAFARHRLHARAPGAPEPGLDAAARGTLAHRALEKLWRRLERQERLLALDAPGRAAVVREVVAEAVAEHAERRPDGLTPRLLALERGRLETLLEGWLALERERAPFRVAERELEVACEVGGLSVRGRIDRLDALADGRMVLIDYKTGSARPSASAWLGERPDEPQLPLYAVSGGYPLAGIAFARVRRGEHGFHGLGEPANLVSGLRDPAAFQAGDGQAFASLAGVLEEWRGTLEALGQAYRAGEARVSPKQPPDTCRHCELGPLCRVSELSGPGPAGGEDSDA